MPRPFLGTRRSKSSAPGTQRCRGCPYPSHGFLCWGRDRRMDRKGNPPPARPGTGWESAPYPTAPEHQQTRPASAVSRSPSHRRPPSLAEHGELSCFRISDKVFSEPTSPGVKLDALAHTTAVRQGTVILQEAAAGDLVGFSNADTVYIRLHVLGHDAHIDQG